MKMVWYTEHESRRGGENLVACHVMQDRVGLMSADELWAEPPGHPSSWVSLALTF